MLNTENLYEGLKIANYKKLSNLLGIEATGGNTKKANLKEFERLVRFEKEGNSYTIKEIYNEIKPKENNRKGGNNNKYSILLKPLILSIGSIKTTKFKLIFEVLGLVNELQYKEKAPQEYMNTYATLNLFIIDNLRKYVSSALNSLAKEGKIILNIHMNVHLQKDNFVRKASINEIHFISECEQRIFTDMKITYFSLRFPNIREKYEEEVKKLTLEQGIDYYYEEVNITNIDSTAQQINKLHYRTEFRELFRKRVESVCKKPTKYFNLIKNLEEQGLYITPEEIKESPELFYIFPYLDGGSIRVDLQVYIDDLLKEE